MKPKFLFGDIVVINNFDIGVICKTWLHSGGRVTYEVYDRMWNRIVEYAEEELERYRVRHKYLSDEEIEWQNN